MTNISSTHSGRGVEVFIREDDGLSQAVWLFWYHQNIHKLVLKIYAYQTRPSTRHKFTTQKLWDKLDSRRSNTERPSYIPDAVAFAAKDMFSSSLNIGVKNES